MKQLVKKIKINTTIELLTGLHIGGSSDNVEIGGIDNPVIKIATKDNQPYIPGSSLKGKMRCLLETSKIVLLFLICSTDNFQILPISTPARVSYD